VTGYSTALTVATGILLAAAVLALTLLRGRIIADQNPTKPAAVEHLDAWYRPGRKGRDHGRCPNHLAHPDRHTASLVRRPDRGGRRGPQQRIPARVVQERTSRRLPSEEKPHLNRE
jgi:hypothetical protein